MENPKREALQLIRRLPTRATWDDIMYEIYVRKKITRGLQAIADGKTVPHEEVKKRFLK